MTCPLGRITLLLLLLASLAPARSQLSDPVAADDDFERSDNKFLTRTADDDEAKAASDEELLGAVCPLNVELKWMTEVSSSVYATPLITDLYSDGRKDIVVPSFVHYLEVLEGSDGAQAAGSWPAFHKSAVHASPLLYDIDFDGVRDVVVATYDGEVLFYKDTGDALPEKLILPRLKVRKDWYVGLNPDPTDHSHPDVGDGDDADAKAGDGLGKGAGAKGAAAGGGSSGGGGGATFKGTTLKTGGPVGGGSGGRLPAPGPAFNQSVSTSVNDKVAEYRTMMNSYRTSYGKDALRLLLQETKLKRPAFFKLLLNHLTPEELADIGEEAAAPPTALGAANSTTNSTAVGTPPSAAAALAAAAAAASAAAAKAAVSVKPVVKSKVQEAVAAMKAALIKPPPMPAGTGRRRLMAAGDADGAAAAAKGAQADGAAAAAKGAKTDGGVEVDPKHRLTDEAISSFNLFQDEDDLQAAGDDGKAKEGEPDRRVQHGTDLPLPLDYPDYRLSRRGGQTDDGAEAGGGAGGAAKLERQNAMKKRDFTYDEFGDRFPADASARGGPGGFGDEDGYVDPDIAMMEREFGKHNAPGDKAGGTAGGALDHGLDKEHYNHMYLGDYGAGPAGTRGGQQWEDEMFEQTKHEVVEEYVFLDAHILCTPAIGDIDNDGHEELVIAVSFFFDREYYDDPEHAPEVKGVNMGKYIASGIVVYDLRTRSQKWVQHLDLSTDETTFKAYAYSTPTLVDINKDGFLEIVVGTSMGFLYVLDHVGDPVAPFPIQMGEIQGQPLVQDLNNDGRVEIFAADTRGNIACYSADGTELWERHVHSLVSQAAVAADVNGDGALEVVFATGNGYIYAVSGNTGIDIRNFPFRTHGRIHASPMVTRLADGPAQHIVVMSFDGFLYMVDGITGCADSVDLGETSYSMVLADDLDNDGRMDLLATTMNGNVYAFTTAARYHPLKTWPMQGASGLLARHDYFGIFATHASRAPRDVAGDKLQVKVTVVDKRSVFAENGTLLGVRGGPYNISVMLQGVGVHEMNAGHSPVIGVADTVGKPGSYQLEVPCPRTRSSATVHIELVDEHGLAFVDEFSVSFHLHFHKLLKWLVALPLAVMVIILLAIQSPDGLDEPMALPSYHHQG